MFLQESGDITKICENCRNLPFCEFCWARPIAKYEENGKKPCVWTQSQNIAQIFNFKQETDKSKL